MTYLSVIFLLHLRNVSNNTLSGLPSCLSNLPSLSTLDVSNNLKLNGSIPSWLCQMNLNVWNGINTSLTPNGALPMSFNLDGATISTLQSTFSAGNPQFCCGDSTRTSMPNYCQSPTGDCALDASKKIFCTNLTIDSSNCQIPGNVCPNNFVCTPDGCADLSSNATSCGTYGNTCPPFYGDDGQNYGSTCISSVCKNTYNDSTCCGIQQAVCDSKSICKKGLCQCNPVTQSGPFWAIDNNSSTNPNCIDTSANLTSCGLTLIQCTLSALNCTMKTPCKPTCSNGTCFNSFDPKSCGGLNQVCTNPTPDCANGICTNFQNDTLNCGGQSKACPPNNVCSRGKCYNLNTDTLNCGVVGSPCNNTTGTVSCVNGACLCSMSSNSTPLNYTVAGCKNFNSDVNNCGALNQQCTSTGLNCQSLSSSTCQPTCIQGQCFNTATDNSHCGLSNKKCSAPSSICSNGNCIPSDCVIVDALFPSLWSVGTNCCANGHISSNVNLVCNAYNQVTNITIGNQPLTSIPDLSGLTALQSLTLTGDNLSNSIPSSICSITTLKSLVLSNNALNGEMPQCLSTLPLRLWQTVPFLELFPAGFVVFLLLSIGMDQVLICSQMVLFSKPIQTLMCLW
ncbi:hypothetical protein BC830DRAFT_336372 [Chytriomyces sp. MP71]|nr:hypothetical protein BC830DRAFT_336372 [Chytriomyces sp. MP71]